MKPAPGIEAERGAGVSLKLSFARQLGYPKGLDGLSAGGYPF
jgi:hypothetical protein